MDRAGVGNLWARRGRARPVICVAGHVDVVPPGPLGEWTSDPFEPTERDGLLFARGASDMKGPLAAAVTALERIAAQCPAATGSLALLVTSDEEGVATDGTVAVVDALRARGETIDYAVVAESTSQERLGDTIKNGRRGSLNGVLTVQGVQAHIAYPHRGRNAVHLGLPALSELTSIEWDGGDEYFPPTSFQISNVSAGTGADNVLPGSMTVWFNFRFSPALTADDLKARVHACLERHGLPYQVAWRLSGQPFLTARGLLTDALSAAIRSATALTPELSTSGGTSDARFLAAIAGEVVEFGPVTSSIHQVDEHIRLADLGPLSRIYEDTIERLFARP
jgi:succinyl-diaminopimelate desuccinylase